MILDGDGMLELWPSPVAADRGATREDIAVRAGHVVARPAGTRIAHQFIAGDGGMAILAYSNIDPNDLAFYPDSNKVKLRGLGVTVRVEPVDYWDGEH